MAGDAGSGLGWQVDAGSGLGSQVDAGSDLGYACSGLLV